MSEEHNGKTTLDCAESPASQEKHEINKVDNNTNIQCINGFLNSLNLLDEKQLASAENFLIKIVRSEKGGIKSVNDGLAILMRAIDLKLPFSTCIEHIHVINGKTGVDIHIIKALLLRAGCTWRCIKDYQPLYEYTDGINVFVDGSFPEYAIRCKSQKEAEERTKEDNDKGIYDNIYLFPVRFYKDFNGNIYRNYQLNSNYKQVATRVQATEVAKSGKIPIFRVPSIPDDYITEYEMHRTINGVEQTSIGKFSYRDALTADLFTKDTYKKYPRILIGHRAFTYAARDIASDVIFGVMETTELKIVAGSELTNNDINNIEDADAIEI